jgi:hypothetical protein
MSDEKPSGRAQGLAMAAALAMLGISVGVNVQELFAGSPPEQMQSKQNKIHGEGLGLETMQSKRESLQQKFDATQNKLPAMQNKQLAAPGVRPIDPSRP